MKPKTGKKRNIGIDLLKIICMFMVIAFHYSDHGSVSLSATAPITFNWVILATCRIWGGICNAVFMLVTGYYLSRDKKFSWKKVIRLYMQVSFFTLLCGVICILYNHGQADKYFIIRLFLPLSSNKYWFFTTYFIIYFIHRYLNVIIDNITREQHFTLMTIGLGVYSVFYTFGSCMMLPITKDLSFSRWISGGNGVIIYVILYFVGAYLRKYNISFKFDKLILLMLLAAEVLLLFFMRAVAAKAGNDGYIYYFSWGTEKIFPILVAIVALTVFKKIDIKESLLSRMIKYVAPSVFAVYLFHIGDMRAFLFKDVFDNSKYYDGPVMILHLLMTMVVLFVVGILLDKIRLFLIDKPLTKPINSLSDRLDKMTEKSFP